MSVGARIEKLERRFKASEDGWLEMPDGERIVVPGDGVSLLRLTLGVSVDEAESVVNRAWGLETGPYPQDLELIRALRVLASWAMFARFAIAPGQVIFNHTQKESKR